MSLFLYIPVETTIAPRETGPALFKLPSFVSKLHFQSALEVPVSHLRNPRLSSVKPGKILTMYRLFSLSAGGADLYLCMKSANLER